MSPYNYNSIDFQGEVDSTIKSRLDTFISSTNYTKLADFKKLKFIFASIYRYASMQDKDIENLHILEVGCGTGGIIFSLASLNCQLRAIDINDSLVEYVQNQANQKKIKNLNVTIDNGYTFDDGKIYDVVIASEVFEHVLEPSKLVANISKRMIEGSYLIVTVPNGYGPWELKNRISPLSYLRRLNRLCHLLGKSPYVRPDGSSHCQFYTKTRLVRLFSRYFLKLVHFAKSDSFFPIVRDFHIKSSVLEKFDIMLADILPFWLTSGWYFVFEMKGRDYQ